MIRTVAALALGAAALLSACTPSSSGGPLPRSLPPPLTQELVDVFRANGLSISLDRPTGTSPAVDEIQALTTAQTSPMFGSDPILHASLVVDEQDSFGNGNEFWLIDFRPTHPLVPHGSLVQDGPATVLPLEGTYEVVFVNAQTNTIDRQASFYAPRS